METNEQNLKLGEHLCFSLYACSRAILRLYRPYLDELELTYPQYLVLVTLWEKEKSTIKELGEALDLDTGTLTPLLKRMEAAGLLERHRDSADERVVNVLITSKGKALQEKATCVPQSLLAASDMESEELNRLNETILQLLEQVNASSKK
ncbi:MULTISPECIES: MarR family winged helix-turn-helix transcriptional regulator [Paenibacillus]|jgi:MarR family transcriptional regulator, organic hydroperoxide resistance regulator|uniref:MarR family winged helix-turn-helix transcriptional regulator n=1 Tax=Paenibacillus TaxID=44249 RepID=UPI00073F9927|nr:MULTISPECIES: MarR family winged helix-turn-helix transcriptional regulator [Paenibacillus]MDU4694435.1 MarR family winged helix-turn-helix transcriptional regulator [Paenibacillus sp.]